MKFFFAIFAFLLPVLPSMAFDFDKISSSLTRSGSDDLFSKDYDYKILADLTVRRSWTEDNRLVSLDYDAASDKLIMAEVKYKEIVPVSMALRDAEAIAGKDLPIDTWKSLKESLAKDLGMDTSRYVRLSDGSYILLELPSKGKVASLSFFSKQPKDNRRSLEEANRVYKTGFGVNPNASAASGLYNDEDNRKSGNAGSIAMTSGSSSKNMGSAPSVRVNVTTGSSGAKGGSGKTISWSSQDAVPVAGATQQKDGTASAEKKPEDELKKDGAWYKSLSTIEWGGILVLAIVGLGFLFNSVSSSNRAEKLVADKKKRDALVRQQRVKMGVKQGRKLK